MLRKKIKIGFILRETDDDGSINYFNNLFSSLKNIKNIEIVIFSDTNSRLKFLKKDFKIIRSPIFKKKGAYFILRKINGLNYLNSFASDKNNKTLKFTFGFSVKLKKPSSI